MCSVWREPGVRDVFCIILELGTGQGTDLLVSREQQQVVSLWIYYSFGMKGTKSECSSIL
ncbi:unnamed protein product, partial [Bubo scandiacus]